MEARSKELESGEGLALDAQLDTEAPDPCADNSPLSYKVKLGYGAGEAGLYGISNLWGFFLASFLLEGAYLKPTYVVIVTVVGQLSDAFTDPLVGLLSDEFSLEDILAYMDKERGKLQWRKWAKTALIWLYNSKAAFLWTGRRKPFIAAALVPMCIAVFLLFLVPPLPTHLSYDTRQFLLFLYYFLVFTIVNVTYGIVGVAYNSLTPDITESYNQRTTLTMYRMMLGMTASLLSVATQATLLTALKRETADGHDDYRFPYAVNVGIWAVVGFLCVVTTLGTVKERNREKRAVRTSGDSDMRMVDATREGPKEKDSTGIRHRHAEMDMDGNAVETLLESDMVDGESNDEAARQSDYRPEDFSMKNAVGELLYNLKDTLSNRAFLLIVACYTCAWVGLNFIQSNLLLYVKYVLLQEELFMVFTLLLQGCAIASLKPWAMVSERIGKKRTFYIGGCMFMISGAGFLLLPAGGGSLAVMLSGSIVSGSCVGCMLLMPWAMLPDVVQLDELNTGKKREGSFYAFFVFFQKVGLGLSLGFSTFVLDMAGYDNKYDIQQATDVDHDVIGPATHEQAPSVIFALRVMVGLFPMVLMAVAILSVYLFPVTRTSHAKVVAELAKRRAQCDQSDSSA